MGGYMIELKNFENCETSGYTYGGAAGSKLGIIIDGEKWFLKYPKSTKSLENVLLSYTTAPLSEYIGSKIYSSIGILTHEVQLGISNEKVVVVVKDFLENNEILYDYNSIKNSYNPNIEFKLESSNIRNQGCNLEEIELMSEENVYFKKTRGLKNHFWDMFIVDALIDNHDRNNGNWGVILNRDTLLTRIAPVYDNGASFYNKNDNAKLEKIYNDNIRFKQVVYDSARTFFRENDSSINPLKYIESKKNFECNRALIRIFPKIDLEIIKNIIDEIPGEFNNIEIISDIQKEFYYKMIEYRYNLFLNVYEELTK